MQKVFSVLVTGIVFFLLSCSREYSCENCYDGNRPPVAIAGTDIKVLLPEDSTVLNGTKSYDPDGSIAKWSWRKISGPVSVLKDSAKAIAAIQKLSEGIYRFELMVTDDKGLSAKDTIQILVTKPNETNRPPVAKAGADIFITLPVSATELNGSASTDPDNNIIGYAWRRISGPASHNFTDPVGIKTQVKDLTEGIYLFELTVTDAGGLFSTDTVQVTVNSSLNKSPVADAGNDITITYNLQNCRIEPASISLNGSLSKDPDGRIVSYEWSLIFAESFSAVITNPFAPVTTVTNLVPGAYSFRLKVTDNLGATDDDTIVINTVYNNRSEIQARLTPVGTLSTVRKVSVVVAANNRIFFAGGQKKPAAPGPAFSDDVDIYNITSNTWSYAKLSQARYGMTAVAIGNKVYFAGGTAIKTAPLVGLTSRIDVYDTNTDIWSTMEMPHSDGQLSSIVSGNKIFIAGGNYVDVYDNLNDRWKTVNLSQPRYLISTLNVRGKLYFAGGITNKSTLNASANIDIYDPVTDTWSVSALSKPKFGMASVFTGGYAIYAGGTTADKMTNEVEMFDPLSGTTSFSCLFQPNSFSAYSVARGNNKVVFFVWDGKTKSKFDIYDPMTKTWYIGVLNQSISPSLIIGIDNSIYVVGSAGAADEYHRQVWKLEF